MRDLFTLKNRDFWLRVFAFQALKAAKKALISRNLVLDIEHYVLAVIWYQKKSKIASLEAE